MTQAPDAPNHAAGPLSPVAEQDPEIWKLIAAEQERQEYTLEMIASENHTSPAVMAATGSCLTNKYCEGYPGKRYYSGCDFYDEIEQIAIDRAKELFGCEYANVQPHSGASANTAVFFALLEPGDTFASIELPDGGHLTHGSAVNMSGKWFNPVHYPLVYDESRDDYGHIDYDAVESLCMEHKPKMLICGFSAYPRTIDFKRFREIADKCGAWLMCDMAHIAGLVAGGSHPSPFPHCDVVTTTTHKTLRGPRGGMILTNNEELAKKFNKAVFPGTQGGPLMHVIAGKAVCFAEDLKPEFKTYTRQVVDNAQTLAAALQDKGYKVASNGTDNHIVLIDLQRSGCEFSGKEAAGWLEDAGIIANMNTVPKDPRSPMKTSGVRLGTSALTTRGFKADEIRQAVDFIDRVLKAQDDKGTAEAVRSDITDLCKNFPMPH